jgi:hypothetical protein
VMIARRKPLSPARFAAITLITSAVLYTHYVGLIFVPLLALWALASPRGIRHGAIVAGALVLGSLPFLFWAPTWLRTWPTSFVPPAPMLEKPAWFVFVLLQSMPATSFLSTALLLGAGIVALFIAVRARALPPDALATAAIFGVLAAALIVLNLREIRYLDPFNGLLCVALAAAMVASGRTAWSQDPRTWTRWGGPVMVALSIIYVAGDVAFAARASAVPKSGIRSFAAAQPFDSATLYVIAPDYMAPTFAFYSRGQRVTYTAFVHRDHPEIMVVANYAAAWKASGAVGEAAAALMKESRRFDYLDLIVDAGVGGLSVMHYDREVLALLHVLEARYRLVSATPYPGRREPVEVYRFAIDHTSGPGDR